MNNTDLFCITSHDSDPVVCLHSSLSSGQQWQKLSRELKACLTPDLLGYGTSAMPAKPRGAFRLSDELEALKGQLYQQPFHLIGHSYGAATAIQIAKHYPQQVLSLTVFEPVAFHLLSKDSPAVMDIQRVSDRIAQDLANQDPQAAATHFIDYWNQEGTYARLAPEVQQYFAQGMEKVAYDFVALLNEPTQLSDLATIQCPVLLLEGLHSPHTTRAVIAALAEQFPNAKRHSFECGHMGPMTDANLVNPVVIEFIATHKKA